ncbi:hypothetical protein [Burkholderia glumae]|uniref:hypothetical protein n=1 Tax=Burkholderia glumae TaxID=337 RepID=UPI0003037B69|nr:sigma-70, region 4 family protein [Burkholderia glumae LMG 2196 = ATCC 33617]KHJ62267.1 hypothetical protein NCPPB3923_14400 [Burkholderia glumae]QKM57193.1 hypothetical protein CG017_05261 [Burkholderia glumae]QTP35672.1 hypothetical protein B7759_04306 [Burkholderia glumae]
MLLLERLSPDERAALLLREAFDCDYAAIGAALARGEPAALGADAGFAWVLDGEITARWVPCLDAHGHPALRVVTQAAALAAANRAVGRRAVAALLARLFRGAARACPAVHG